MVSAVADIVSLYVSCLTAEHEPGPWFPTTVFSAVCLYFRYFGLLHYWVFLCDPCLCLSHLCLLPVSSPRLFTCSSASVWFVHLTQVLNFSFGRCRVVAVSSSRRVLCVFCVLLQTSGCAFVLHRLLSLCCPTIIRLQSPALPTSCFHAATDFVNGCIKTC